MNEYDHEICFIDLEYCPPCNFDPYGEEAEYWDDENLCGCCMKGLDFKGENGWCNCSCDKCDKIVRDCRYNCKFYRNLQKNNK
jgi:hypothetical protein